MTMVTKVLVNKAQCKLCKDIIESKSVHDCVSCKCGEIFVDGGLEYSRRGAGDFKNLIELSVTKRVKMEPLRQQAWDKIQNTVRTLKLDKYKDEFTKALIEGLSKKSNPKPRRKHGDGKGSSGSSRRGPRKQGGS